MAPVRRPEKKCPHGRRRVQRHDCGGASICQHKRRRAECRNCGGSSVCEHGRLRRQRHGAAFCEHGRQRAHCRDCGGASVCEHGRLRAQCRECGGAAICEHGRQRAQCRDCGGTTVCEHGRKRYQCRECGNFVCQIRGCPRQDLPFAGAPSLLRHMRTMHGDNPRSVTKSKELEAHQALRDAQIAFEYQQHLPFRGCGLESETAHAFADFALPTPWGHVRRLTRSSIRPTTPAATCAGTLTWPPAWRSQTAGAALQPGRLQDRRHDSADHQEGAPRAADPPAGRAVGARAGGACHPPLSLLRPGLRRTTHCPAWRSPCAPCPAAHDSPPYMGSKSWLLSLLRFWKPGVLPRRPASGPGGAWRRRL